MASLVAGIDVGGTFTDLVLLSPTGALAFAKVPTTPDDQSRGALAALSEAQVPITELDLIAHGTTTTTNAVLTRNLARTGLITTQGFRDVLELGRRTRPNAYGMTGSFKPIIPRNLRLEVPERLDAGGAVVTPLDEEAVRAATQELLEMGCEAIVVHFLHAYANPAHEALAGRIIRAEAPGLHVTLGSDILSESREYERGVTAAVNASVQPLIARYLDRFVAALKDRGYPHSLSIMNGNGGTVSVEQAASEAAKTVMSGPASGVMAAAYTARRAGVGDLITYDMGGTSTDVALIRGTEPGVSSEIELEYGLPVHVPMVDVRTIGAGGGSIARVTGAGLLDVGPQSAGAEPGPICYGRGGHEPTISDANFLLGRLDPSFASTVTRDAVAEVFASKIAAPLGLSVTQAAEAVIRMAGTKMAGAIRMVSLSLGADPRDFTLFAFGGAGPLHATALAAELGIGRVMIPARPGLTNALGCAVADLRHDFVQGINCGLDQLAEDDLARTLAAQEADGRARIAAQAVPVERIHVRHFLDMQFSGQTHVLRIPLPGGSPARATIREIFERAYFDRFRVTLAEILPVIVAAATSVIGERPPIDLSELVASGDVTAPTGNRRVVFDGQEHDTPVYARDGLSRDLVITGPAIVTQMDTTILIDPGWSARQDADGNLILEAT